MTKITELETKRLKLRQWTNSDYPIFAEINSDTEVMEYFPETLDETKSNDLAQKIESIIASKGWGFWALETKQESRFIGFTGLHQPVLELPFSPCVEIGWRLSKDFWGNGYATEAALACLEFAFETLELEEVVSFTSVLNKRSQTVMQRLNMVKTKHNFDHPALPEEHPLCEHVLYKITKLERKNVSR